MLLDERSQEVLHHLVREHVWKCCEAGDRLDQLWICDAALLVVEERLLLPVAPRGELIQEYGNLVLVPLHKSQDLRERAARVLQQALVDIV